MIINWKEFEVKNKDKEQSFEDMSYLLFCSEFDNNIGLFRYTNQTGIETEPLEKDGKLYGFSAKYYDAKIIARKKEIIEAITKAKTKNPNIETIYFYINQELSESPEKDKKKPKYQIEIDEACKTLGVTLEWRVPSNFELQLALPKHKYIYDLFFKLNPTLDKLIDNVFSHNENIFKAIRTDIHADGKQIKINRQSYVSDIDKLVEKQKHIIISGEGGSGKTALFKEFYQQFESDLPICIFKATELNVNHVSDLFRFEHNFTTADFFDTYENEVNKLFVIDSAEKIPELSNPTVLNDLISKLTQHGWTIVFTTRTSYLEDLTFHIKESYQLECSILKVPLISADELIKHSNEFGIELPSNHNFQDRLRNLFYLNEYITFYQNMESIDNFSSFIDLLWKKKIQNNINQKNNIHIERGRCFAEIAKQRASSNRFYISGDNLSAEALSLLKQDEILGYDEQHDGYFITHDIYEEWALNHIVNKVYQNHATTQDFFDELGDSLAMRRAFRLWLSQQLMGNEDNQTKTFINNIFTSNTKQFWKDELLVSVLLSDYSVEFFGIFESELIENEYHILKRILFLLQVACKDITSELQNTKPKGKGWQATIEFISNHKADFFDNNRNLVMPILLDWCTNNSNGTTTTKAGLLAISVLKTTENGENIYHSEKLEEIYKVVFISCQEVKEELQEIFDKVVKHGWTEHGNPYQDFCITILSKCYLAVPLIQLLPQSIIQLCELFWVERKPENDYINYSLGVDSYYGLTDEHALRYHCPSAYQTPVYWLLHTNQLLNVISFIIRFTNQCIEKYSQSNLGKEDIKEIKLYLLEPKVLHHSPTLWSMYRGNGSPVTPYLLQSVHMALEKFLLELAEYVDVGITKGLLLKILTDSTSTSLTSVVCSVVLAHPQKFHEIALILFKSIELFGFDTMRWCDESQAKSLYQMFYGVNTIQDILYTNERLKTCEDEHRKSNLEHLCKNYQFYGVQGFSEKQNLEFIEKINQIIDQHKADLDSNDEYGSILLARMDRRNLNVELSEDKKQITFTPVLTEEQKQISDNAQIKHNEQVKYLPLKSWSDYLREDPVDKSSKYEEYENDPLLALADTKILITELEKGTNSFDIFNSTTPFYVCANLVIKYSHLLSGDDKLYCKEIILSSIQRLFLDSYGYQLSDGLEVCTHAIPKLIEEFPNESDELLLGLIGILFDKRSIGEYKRICDYAIETIHQEKVWQNQPEVAKTIINDFILLKPIYNEAINVLQNSKDYNYRRGISKLKIFEKFSNLVEERNLSDITQITNIEIDKLKDFQIDDLETIIQLMPNDTNDPNHLAILQSIIPSLAEQLLKDRRETQDIHNIFELRRNVFKKFMAILLNRENTKEIEPLLRPFLDNLKKNKESEILIEKFVWVEDELNQSEKFWHVWKLLYTEIVKLYTPNSYFRHSDSLITNYLFAWGYWREEAKEWHSLKENNLWLYEKTSKDLGFHPSVLYSIAKILTSIGSNFQNQGVGWVHNVVSKHPSLDLQEVKSNTIFNLENYLREYISLNRQNIKQTVRLKDKIIAILDFMVERGSEDAYLLRESIL